LKIDPGATGEVKYPFTLRGSHTDSSEKLPITCTRPAQSGHNDKATEDPITREPAALGYPIGFVDSS
jgi:hypothetical protein